MKRTICLFTALLLLLLPACGDTSSDPSEPPETQALPETSEPTPEPTHEPSQYEPLTGLPCDENLSGTRPAAVMLNNLKSALPQQGNSQADIIYEVLAEGGITRMLGIYQHPERVGPIGSVRSARQYFWELSQGHNAVFIHAGGSPEFYETKSRLGLFTVDGVNGAYSLAGAGMFWRNRERIEGHYYDYEHSLLTSGEAIAAMLEQEQKTAYDEGFTYEMAFADDGTPSGGKSAATVTVPFSNYKSGVFHYDQASGQYLVEEYGEPYIDGNDNTQVAVTNLIVVQTTCTVVDSDGRLNIDLTSGNGWFACGGQMIPITWEKGSPEQQLRFFTQDGASLTLGRGKSYVCVIPTTREVTAE